MTIAFEQTIPVLRMFSVDKMREFYLDWLGFTIDWEHRFDANAPLYLQVSRASLILHLSEHHGDGTPGSVVFIRMRGIAAFHAELTAKDYRYARPGLENEPWGRTVTVGDPFGNSLRFCEKP